jgi:hypothetical protein
MTYTLNQEHNGVELFFDSKPSPSTLSTLKTGGWRWNSIKKCWYNKQTDTTISTARDLAEGKEPTQAPKTAAPQSVTYHKKVSDYISLDTFRERLEKILRESGNYYATREAEKQAIIQSALKDYDSEKEYHGLTEQIRHAIIAKSLNMESKRFPLQYRAIWPELPTIKGLKPGAVYSATWGYDQTNITTARHYGRAFGLDVLVTGGFGSGDVLLKRIDKNGRFSESCMHFSPNRYTAEEIKETNEYASYFGH